MSDDKPHASTPPPSPARQGGVIGLAIGVGMAVSQLTRNATQGLMSETGTLIVAVLAAGFVAAIVATVAHRLLLNSNRK